MNRLLRLFLLVSLGLNLGLGWVVMKNLREPERRLPASGRAWRERPAPDDSAAWRRMMHHRLERLSTVLELEPAQAERLQQLQVANGPVVREHRERIEAARLRVREAADAGGFDTEGVRSALVGLRHAQAELDSLTQEFLMQEFSVMTPPQRARYLELLPLDPWRSGRPGGPGGPGGQRGPEGPGDLDGGDGGPGGERGHRRRGE